VVFPAWSIPQRGETAKGRIRETTMAALAEKERPGLLPNWMKNYYEMADKQ
jgi:hypothetical protein